MPAGVIGQDSPVASGGGACLYEMTVAMGEVRVARYLGIVVSPEIVSQLVTEAEVPEGAGLGGDGDGVAAGEGGEVGHAATVEVLGQQGSGISRVSQRCGGSLHVGEGADEGGGVRDVVDGGRLDTEPGHRHGNLTVGVALVSLGYNLVDIAGNV